MPDASEDEWDRVLQDVQRRRRTPPAPKSIGVLINRLLAKRGYAQVQAVRQWDDTWHEVVGSRLAKDSRIGKLNRGTLEITVRNSAVVQELMFQKRKILKKLGESVPNSEVRDLRFRVGPLE